MTSLEETRAFEQIAALIEGSTSVVVSGHTDPDGDALGSVLAMVGILERRWPHLSVQPLLANDRPVDEAYAFLPGVERFVPAARYEGVPDLFIAVDTPLARRLADAEPVLARARASASIDHHPAVEALAQVNVVRTEACAAGAVVADFMAFLGVEPTPQIATCLLTALMTDTGRFQYQNTDAQTLRTAAAMVEAGASPTQVSAHVYQSYRMPALKLKQVTLARLATAHGGDVAYSYVTQGDLARWGATAADCDSLIDDVRLLRDTRACLFMRELPDGSVRGNLRAKDEAVDVSAVAGVFDGGGHRAAAGFSAPGPIDEALGRAVDALCAALDALDACGADAPASPSAEGGR